MIITPSVHYGYGRSKVFGFPQINYDSPYARGLRDVILFNNIQEAPNSLIIREKATTVFGSPTWTSSQGLYGRRYGGAANDAFVDDNRRVLLGALTIAISFVSETITSDTTWRVLFNRGNSAGTIPFEYGFAFNNNTLGGLQQFYWRNTADQLVTRSTAGPVAPNVAHTYVFTRTPAATGGSIYVDGAIFTTSTGLTAPTAGAAPLSIGSIGSGFAAPFVGTVFYWMMWDREFTPAEVADFTRKPYQVILSPQSNLILPATVVGGIFSGGGSGRVVGGGVYVS